MKQRDGYDIAWAAVIVIGVFLAVLVGVLGADLVLNNGTGLSDNGQLVIVSALGTIGSIAGGAVGFTMGRRDDTDPVTDTGPVLDSPDTPYTGSEPAAVELVGDEPGDLGGDGE